MVRRPCHNRVGRSGMVRRPCHNRVGRSGMVRRPCHNRGRAAWASHPTTLCDTVSTPVVAWSPDRTTSPDHLLWHGLHLLWHGLLTVPLRPTEGLHEAARRSKYFGRPSVSPSPDRRSPRSGKTLEVLRETFGQPQWHGQETMPQRVAVKAPVVARSPDRATSPDRRSPLPRKTCLPSPYFPATRLQSPSWSVTASPLKPPSISSRTPW
jgi:hypothetical protein